MATVITLLLALSLAMLVRIAWSGMVFDLPVTTPRKDAAAKAETTGKRAP